MLNSRSFYWREWVVALIGFCTPYILMFSVYFILDKTQTLTDIMSNQLSFPSLQASVDFRYIALFVYLSIVMFASMFFLYKVVLKKVNIRKFYGMFLIIWIVIAVIYLVIPSVGLETVFFFAIPFAYFVSNYLIRLKSRLIQRIILWGLVFSLFIANFA